MTKTGTRKQLARLTKTVDKAVAQSRRKAQLYKAAVSIKFKHPFTPAFTRFQNRRYEAALRDLVPKGASEAAYERSVQELHGICDEFHASQAVAGQIANQEVNGGPNPVAAATSTTQTAVVPITVVAAEPRQGPRQGIIGLSIWALGVGDVIDCYAYVCKLKFDFDGYKCGDLFIVYTIGEAKYFAKIFNRRTTLCPILLATAGSQIVVETVKGRYPIRLNFNVPGLYNHYVKVNSMLTLDRAESKRRFTFREGNIKDINFFNATASLVETIQEFEIPIVYREATVLVDDLPSEDLKGHKWEGWAYNHDGNDLIRKRDWVAPPIAHPVNFLDMDDSRVSSNSSVPSSPSGSGASSRTQVPNRAPPGSSTPPPQQGSSKDRDSFAEASSQLEPNVSPSAGAADLSYESNSSLSQAETSLGGGSLVMALPRPPARNPSGEQL